MRVKIINKYTNIHRLSQIRVLISSRILTEHWIERTVMCHLLENSSEGCWAILGSWIPRSLDLYMSLTCWRNLLYLSNSQYHYKHDTSLLQNLSERAFVIEASSDIACLLQNPSYWNMQYYLTYALKIEKLYW